MSSKQHKGGGKQKLVSVSVRDLQALLVVSVATLAAAILMLVLTGAALQSIDTGAGLSWLRLFTPVGSIMDLLLVLFGAILLLALGILGYFVSKVPSRIVPFFWLSMLTIAFEGADFFGRLALGVSWLNIVGFVLALGCFVCALRLRKQLIIRSDQ